MHNWNIWIANSQQFTTKLYVWRSLKHENIYDWLTRINVSYVIKKSGTYKDSISSPPSDKCPWKLTSYSTSNGIFFSGTNTFNSGFMEIVASSPSNKNPKISDSILIKLKFLSMFWLWTTSRRCLDIRFLFGGWYIFYTFLAKSNNILNRGSWARLKKRPLKMIRS